jgi:hypothetical protein
MRRHTGSPAVGLRDGWTYSETIDEERSAIRARGRLDRLAADLLCGTIEELHRRGHTDIAVTIESPYSVDESARAALTEIGERLARRHGRLTLTWSDGNGSCAPTNAPRHRPDGVAARIPLRPIAHPAQKG